MHNSLVQQVCLRLHQHRSCCKPQRSSVCSFLCG
uniref:Uncharacterized protein n=1 Tax=Arundo donax TaxID=35708 RepID=A0A0A9BFH4_ARUDO